MRETNFSLMENTPVYRAVIKLSLPTVLSSIAALIYNLTDTYFIGLLDDPVQLGAISLAFPVFIVLQAMGNIFGNGAPPYASRCLGAKNYAEARRTSSVSTYMAVIIALVMSALFFIFRDSILAIIGTSKSNIAATGEYLDITMGFGALIIFQTVLPAFLRAEGKTGQAVTGVVIGTVLNIVLDPVFIVVLHKGVAGAAWATIIGCFAASVYFVGVYIKGKTTLSIHPRDFRPSKRILGQVLKIGVPSSLAQLATSLANLLLHNVSAVYGDHVIPAYGVASKLTGMVYMSILGFASGYMPFAGYNYGAGNIKRMLSSMRFALILSTAVCIAMLIPVELCGGAFMRAFTSEADIIEVGIRLLRAQAWSIALYGIQVTLMCTFQAAGKAISALIVSMGRQVLFFIPMLYIFNALWELNGVLYAPPAADAATTAVAVAMSIPMTIKLKKQMREKNAEKRAESMPLENKDNAEGTPQADSPLK